MRMRRVRRFVADYAAMDFECCRCVCGGIWEGSVGRVSRV